MERQVQDQNNQISYSKLLVFDIFLYFIRAIFRLYGLQYLVITSLRNLVS